MRPVQMFVYGPIGLDMPARLSETAATTFGKLHVPQPDANWSSAERLFRCQDPPRCRSSSRACFVIRPS